MIAKRVHEAKMARAQATARFVVRNSGSAEGERRGQGTHKCTKTDTFGCKLVGVAFQKYACRPGGEHKFGKK